MSQASQYILFLVYAFDIETASALRFAGSPKSQVLEDKDEMGDFSIKAPLFDLQEWDEAWDASMKLQRENMNIQPDGFAKDGTQNLCIDGHLAPEFFLIGAQKSATSSFSSMLAHPNLVRPKAVYGEPGWYSKELHIFSDQERMAKGKDFWLSHYPECTTEKRLVATDMTPAYMRAPEAPKNMKKYYGEQLDRVKLASVIRNPVHRIQSAFHFYQGKNLCKQKYIANGFKYYVEGIIKGFDPCGFVAASKYHEQIKSFLDVVNSSQFIGTFPMLEVVAPVDGVSRGNVAVMEAFSVSARPAKIQHTNGKHHATLEDDVGDVILLQKFQSYVDSQVDAKKVAQVHIDNNIKVFGYSGPQDVGALADFLKSRW